MTVDEPSSSASSTLTTSQQSGGGGSYWKFWTWGSHANIQAPASIISPGATPATAAQSSVQSVSRIPETTPNTKNEPPAKTLLDFPPPISVGPPKPTSGWEEGLQKVKEIYTDHISMERDVMERVARMSFFGGFLMGGASGYANAHRTYATNNVGRKYLSPSDATKRRLDYAIVRFAKSGFGMGFKCALISGSIVVLTTHLSAYRQQFSSLYLPALSGAMALSIHTVGSVFAFPLGIIGSAKACGMGITSGFTLAAVVQLYALSVDKSSNDAYWLFKREYEKELRANVDWERRVTDLMKREGIQWRQSAVKRLRQLDEESLVKLDA